MTTPAEYSAAVDALALVMAEHPGANKDEAARLMGTTPGAPAFGRAWAERARDRHERLVGYLLAHLDELDEVGPSGEPAHIGRALMDARRIAGR